MSDDAASEAFLAANQFFVSEDYENAAVQFDIAVQNKPNNAVYLLNRAANFVKLSPPKLLEALQDLDTCIQIEPNNHFAAFKKGTVLFQLGQFENAKAAFEQSHQNGNKQADLWIRKCNAELHFQAKASGNPAPVQFPAKSQQVPPSSAPTASPSPAPPGGASLPSASPSTAPASSPSSSSPNATPPTDGTTTTATPASAPAVREDWYQMGPAVTITLFIKGLKQADVTHQITTSSVHVDVKLPSGTTYSRDWQLFAPTIPEEASVKVTPYKLEISLKKVDSVVWDALCAVEKPVTGIKRENIVQPSVPKPYASKKDVDWDKVEAKVKKDEEEENPDGEAALTKLFRKIYSNADEDTRRAMIKSYQTSGGTVLSTNWKEVAKKDYEKELEPPKGSEVYRPEY